MNIKRTFTPPLLHSSWVCLQGLYSRKPVTPALNLRSLLSGAACADAVCKWGGVRGGEGGGCSYRPTSLSPSQGAPKLRSANSPKSSYLLLQDCSEPEGDAESCKQKPNKSQKWSASGNGEEAEWSSCRVAEVSPEATGSSFFFPFSLQRAVRREEREVVSDLTVTSVLSPRRDGLCSGIQLGPPERLPARRGTLGRRPTGQTQAVRRTKVGKCPRGALLSLWKPIYPEREACMKRFSHI